MVFKPPRSIKCHLLVVAIVRSRAGQQPAKSVSARPFRRTRRRVVARLGTVGTDGEPGPHPFQRFWSDPLHAPEIVDRAERPILLAVRDNPPGKCVTDPIELSPLNPSGGIDVDAVFDLTLRQTIDFDRHRSPPRDSQPVCRKEREHYEQDHRKNCLVRMAEPKTRSSFVRGGFGGTVRTGTGVLQPRLAFCRSSRGWLVQSRGNGGGDRFIKRSGRRLGDLGRDSSAARFVHPQRLRRIASRAQIDECCRQRGTSSAASARPHDGSRLRRMPVAHKPRRLFRPHGSLGLLTVCGGFVGIFT